MARKQAMVTVLAGTALAVSAAVPALAAPAAGTRVEAPRSAATGAFAPGTGRLVAEWNKTLISILGTQGAQFRPEPPPPVTSARYARALSVVERLGEDTSTTRTPDQTAAGKFWGAAPIWNVWNEVAQDQVIEHDSSLQGAASMFATLDLALADTAIGLYDGKYHYLVWRPVTAIREGATTGNPGIVPNPAWNPLTPTAPDPSYPGAHSGFSFAAATVLTAFFGDDQPVTVHSDALPGQTRGFPDFFAAATEAALSRIFAGQHTPLDDRAGRRLGASIARFTLRRIDPFLGEDPDGR